MLAPSLQTETQTDDMFFADVIAAINSEEFKNVDVSSPPVPIQQKINNFIKRGIFFAVKAETFEIAAGAERLTEGDLNFLDTNAAGVLLHLQQMLLCKDFFDYEPTFLKNFMAEITERENLISIGANKISNDAEQAIVGEVTRSWFITAYGGNK